ncbi:MAG: hypothetical protein JWM56_814 [Candidatus Peribacteria bacterium]|nr:hypothetical protein [Candidatus Peribacteria bacterium]
MTKFTQQLWNILNGTNLRKKRAAAIMADLTPSLNRLDAETWELGPHLAALLKDAKNLSRFCKEPIADMDLIPSDQLTQAHLQRVPEGYIFYDLIDAVLRPHQTPSIPVQFRNFAEDAANQFGGLLDQAYPMFGTMTYGNAPLSRHLRIHYQELLEYYLRFRVSSNVKKAKQLLKVLELHQRYPLIGLTGGRKKVMLAISA